MTVERLIFAILFFGSTAFFAYSLYRLFFMLCLGRWENRFDRLGKRLWDY